MHRRCDTHTHTHTQAHTHTHTPTHTDTYPRARAHTHTHARTRAHACRRRFERAGAGTALLAPPRRLDPRPPPSVLRNRIFDDHDVTMTSSSSRSSPRRSRRLDELIAADPWLLNRRGYAAIKSLRIRGDQIVADPQRFVDSPLRTTARCSAQPARCVMWTARRPRSRPGRRTPESPARRARLRSHMHGRPSRPSRMLVRAEPSSESNGRPSRTVATGVAPRARQSSRA